MSDIIFSCIQDGMRYASGYRTSERYLTDIVRHQKPVFAGYREIAECLNIVRIHGYALIYKTPVFIFFGTNEIDRPRRGV